MAKSTGLKEIKYTAVRCDSPFQKEAGCLRVLLCAVFPVGQIVEHLFCNPGASVVRGAAVYSICVYGKRARTAAVRSGAALFEYR